ncbi:MAG TPA: SPFH domain-containing protein, partial [Candidatus Limnocylindrales bacterium]|nr:SPFH domain-containing protein [Candidatus Limnocylindrales bacterium]
GTDFAEKIIDPAFNDFIKSVVPEYSVNDILAKRDEIRLRAKDQLATSLSRYHIVVDDIFIANIAFSDAFQQAIEDKQVAQQQVQTEQQILAQKQIQAQQAVAQAQGQADSTVALAKGQAEANGLLSASLTDQILQYQYIQKLSDKITVMLLPAGNGTIFDLKSLLGQATASPAP